MAAPTRPDLFGMFGQGHHLTKHPLHPRGGQQEPPTTETFASSSIISPPSWKNIAGQHLQLDFENAADALVPMMRNNHQSFSTKAAAESADPTQNMPFAVIAMTPVTLGASPPRMRQQRSRAFRKWLNCTFGRLFKVDPTTPRMSTTEPTASQDSRSMQNPLDDFKPHERTQDGRFHSSIVTQAVSPSRSVLTIQYDQQSMHSNNSEVPNNWQAFLFIANLDGQEFKVLAQFDSGSPSNFISRATLNKLGRITVHPIPSEAWKKYSSPVCDGRMAPTHCVYVNLWNEKLNLNCRKAKLKILESDFVQIIIGRGIMQNQEVNLVERLMNLGGDDIPNDDEDVQLMAALFSQNRTDNHQAMDAKRNQIHEQAFRDRQMILAGTLPLPSYNQTMHTGLGSPCFVVDASQIPASHLAPASARRLLVPVQQPSLPPLLFNPQQKISSSSAEVPDYHTELQRHGTNSSTPGTIHTQYSWCTEGTTSSVSSWNSVGSSKPKIGGPTPMPSSCRSISQDGIVE